MMLQVQHMEAICEEVARRMNPVLAELFATKQELAEVVAKSAVDNEELRAEHNKLLAAGQETMHQNAKVLEENFQCPFPGRPTLWFFNARIVFQF